MDIAALATSLSQTQLQNNVGVAVARKTQDAQQQQGEAAVALIQAAVKVQEVANSQGASPRGIGEAVDVNA